MNATYTRGTVTTKVTTLRAAGHVLLTIDGGEGLALVAHTKTGAVLREAVSVERVAPSKWERNTRIVVHFADGTRSMAYSSSQTWMAVEAPQEAVVVAAIAVQPALGPILAAEAARKAPAAPAVTEEAPAAPETAPEAQEATKAYRIGKLLREFVLASDDDGHHRVSAALVEHVASRNVCYDGTATLRLTPAFAEELIDAASAMDDEAKAAARAARATLYKLFA